MCAMSLTMLMFVGFCCRNPNTPGTEEWPQYFTDTQKYLSINQENKVGQYLYSKETNFWREIIPGVMNSDVSAHSSNSPFSKKSSDTCDSGSCG